MSEWLDLMLEEVRRKEREAQDAAEEQQRRADEQPADVAEDVAQSK